MSDVGLNIKVSADVKDAVRALGGLNDNLVEIATDGTTNIQGVNLALADLRKAAQNAGNTQELGMFNRAIRDLSVEAKNLKNVGLDQSLRTIPASANAAGSSLNTLSFNTRTARLGFIDLFRVVQGGVFSPRTLAANFALLGPAGLVAGAAIVGLIDILNHQTDAEKKAAEQAKQLAEYITKLKSATEITDVSTGSAAGEIARVRDLAAAVEDGNRSYKERQRALQELKTTNKSYFGDLSLEESSMKSLTQRVKEYSDAIVTEAIIKGQTEEIAKMSEELLKAVRTENQLRDAMTRARAEAAKPQPITPGSAVSGGPDVLNNAVLANAQKAEEAFYTQRDAVDKLRGSIAEYNDELNTNIGIQLKQRPLKIVKPEDEKGLESILSKIREVKAELAKPQEGSLFKLNQQANDPDIAKLFQTKIADAIAEGAKVGTAQSRQYAQELANLYRQELTKVQNPDLHAHIQGTITVTPDALDKMTSEVEKQFGAKEIKVKIPVGLEEGLKDQGFNKEEIQLLLKKSAEDATKNLPTIHWTPKIQLLVNQSEIADDFKKQLTESLNKAISSSASNGLDSIGKAIGASIAKGQSPVKAAGEAILGTVGGLIEQMGQALVKYGVETVIIQDVLKSGLDISPGVAIAAGVAMIAAGELVKKSFKVPAFAEGGVVTGPTYGLIGEAGPEAIFPLSKLSDFMSSLPGRQEGSAGGGTFTIRGQDLVLVNQRANKNLNFVGKAG